MYSIMRNMIPFNDKVHFKCQRFLKKGSLFKTQKVSVFPKIGVFFWQNSAKRGGIFIPGEH